MYPSSTKQTRVEKHEPRLTSLGWLTLGFTVCVIVILVWTGMRIVLPQTAPIIYAGIVLPVAIIVGLLLGLRFAPLAAVLMAIMILLSQGAFLRYILSIPEQRMSFAWALLVVATTVGLVISGTGAQLERFSLWQGSRRATYASILLLLGATGGGLIVNLLPRQSDAQTTTVVSNEAQVIQTIDFRFGPDRIAATAGTPIEIAFTNAEPVPHDFVIDDLNVAVRIPPGTERQGTSFTVDQAGTYTFYCSVPGHRELGMQGILDVQP